MQLSAHQVRAKARLAVKRREEDVEQEEIEGGEINLVPYLDIVTNLMLFLLASVTVVLVLGQLDTSLPDKGPPAAAQATPPNQNPNEQPLGLIVSVTKDKLLLWSTTGLEGTLKEPKLVLDATGKTGDACDGGYMCQQGTCNLKTQRCESSNVPPVPVFDYRRLNQELYNIAKTRYTGKRRPMQTYQIVLMADDSTPYATIVSVMGTLRCKMPEFGKHTSGCKLPTDDEAAKKAPNPIDEVGMLFDTERVDYDADKLALFHNILFSSGFR